MFCKATPSEAEKLTCKTCVSACLATKPETLAATLDWDCPECTDDGAPVVPRRDLGDPVRRVADGERDGEQAAGATRWEGGGEANEGKKKNGPMDVLDVIGLGGILDCSFCKELPERPVTTPCGHNFCLKCFQKWVGQERQDTCVTCCKEIPKSMKVLPRINYTLVSAIRPAKRSKSNVTGGPAKKHHIVHNQHRPDIAFRTERAQKTGNDKAASGNIFFTIPKDHFGLITAANDPERNQGVLVGESWEDRLESQQWGAHFPLVAGIAGQSGHGAQSVVLSGGYQDDEDHGEWFLYTGSGGRDSRGQSFDQTFQNLNKALQVSCLKGYPVRVVRSHEQKHSSYAPAEKGARYDGCYRIEKCWGKVGIQGFKMCRYLFVRCDNEPAPWMSDEHGDRPRPLPLIAELKKATDITERQQTPSWDFDVKDGCWTWKKPAPVSRLPVQSLNPEDQKGKRKAQNMTVRESLLKELRCQICKQVMNSPMTTPCAHNFCSCVQKVVLLARAL